MNHVERFRAVMAAQPVDRLPVIEWAGWWDKTLDRWRAEGLPANLTDAADIRAHLGLDPYLQFWIRAVGPNAPAPASHGAGIAEDLAAYQRLRPLLYPPTDFAALLKPEWVEQHRRGDLVIWLTLEGFFWFPRRILGIERHLYAFHDQPEIIHRINEDVLEFNLEVVRGFCRILKPEFATIAEDMSYNLGPMVSRACFDEFIAPYYRRLVPLLLELGVTPIVDSDGDIAELVPWFESVGVQGLLPLERAAGVDVVALRRKHPGFGFIGAYDKMVMWHGEAAMRAEFERLLPAMRAGRFIPSCDHQTPPQVSLADYRIYTSLLREYAVRGASARA